LVTEERFDGQVETCHWPVYSGRAKNVTTGNDY